MENGRDIRVPPVQRVVAAAAGGAAVGGSAAARVPVLGYAGTEAAWAAGAAVYTLDPAGVGRAVWITRVRVTIRSARLFVGVIGVFAVFLWRDPTIQLGRATVLVWGGTLGISAAALGWGIVRSGWQARRAWESYRLFVLEESVTRRLRGFADFTLSREQVRRVEENQLGVVLYGANKTQSLFVPKETEGFAGLREKFAGWREIEAKRIRWYRGVPNWFAPVGSLALIIAAMSTTGKWPGMATCAAAIGLLLWSSIMVFRSPNVPRRTKWVGILAFLPMLGLVCKLVYHIVQ